MYRLSKEEYSNLFQDDVTSKYKKTDKRTAANINEEGIKHASEAHVIDRIEINGTGNSFILLKNHQENFNRPTARLLNPTKNENGRTRKLILQNINKTLAVRKQKNSRTSFKSYFKKKIYT